MNTKNFTIESNDIALAQSMCSQLDDIDIRNRTVATMLAGNIAAKFFAAEYEVDVTSGLHNVSAVVNDIDISDIYIAGNYIDVRLVFDEAEMCVPAAHFSSNLLPVAYMFIKVNEELSGAEVIGFISPENIITDNVVDGYYVVEENQLQSFYDIESLIISKDDTSEIDDKEFYLYLENNIENKTEFYSILLNSELSRRRFVKIAKAQSIFNFVSVTKAQELASVNEEIQESNSETEGDGLLLSDEADVFSLDNDETVIDDVITDDMSFDNDLEQSVSIDTLEDSGSQDVFDVDNDDLEDVDLSVDESGFVTESNEIDFENDNINLENDDDISIAEDLSTLEMVDDDLSDAPELVSENISNEPIADYQSQQEELVFIEEDANDDFIVQDSFSSIEESSVEETEEELIVSDDSIEDSIVIDDTPEEEIKTDFVVENNSDDEETDVSVDVSQELEESILDELSNAPEDEYSTVVARNDYNMNEDEQEKPIGVLFNNDVDAESESYQTESTPSYVKEQKKPSKGMSKVFLLALILSIAAAGYYYYMNFMPIPNGQNLNNNDIISDLSVPEENTQPKQEQEDAMPVETVESSVEPQKTNEAVSVTIPSIEQNLDASILVSNLKVDWEVPSGYASNTAAKRYLVKLGKIIQLNLKTELLLLSKPPITNKIAVELSYNGDTKKFDVANMVVSSGEKSVDDVILQTIKMALSMNLSVNTDSFTKLQGNPVLIIHL